MIGLGCMRLSTSRDRDDQRSLTVIRAALDAGITVLDTADSYAQNETDRGHNERLIARALAEWGGDRSITVATKGGLRRPGSEWVPDGRAKHLRDACDASRRALGEDTMRLGRSMFRLLPFSQTLTPTSASVLSCTHRRRNGLSKA